jgi:hypothetical protein
LMIRIRDRSTSTWNYSVLMGNASSMSITGMSSFIGYMSLQASQIRPSCASVSLISPLHLGQQSMSSSSLLIGIIPPYIFVSWLSLLMAGSSISPRVEKAPSSWEATTSAGLSSAFFSALILKPILLSFSSMLRITT